MRHALVAAVLLTCACEPPSTSPSSSVGSFTPQAGETEAIGWAHIDAASGGALEIPDGAELVIPPGALSADTTIVVRVPSSPSPVNRVYVLEPEGTKFSKPAILHIPYPDNAQGKDPMAIVHAASDLHPELNAGSELTHWAPLDVVGRDEDANLLSVELDHFTFVYATFAVDEGAYLVVDYPWEFLRPADVLVTLTKVSGAKGPNWQPGHVGMIRRTPGGPNMWPAGTIVESTPPKVTGSNATGFKTDPTHLYLGARRPKGTELTDPRRKKVVDWAVSKIGSDYSLTGQGNHGALQYPGTTDTYSCVGLVEAAYDRVNRGMLNLFREVSLSTPIEMFLNTEPVTEIEVDVGQTLKLPIYGVVVDTGSPYVFNTFRGWYQRDTRYSISAGNLPEGAKFTGSATAGYVLEFTPTVEHACNNDTCPAPGKPYDITIVMDANPKANVMGSVISLDPVHIEQTLRINVLGNSATKNLPAIDLGMTQHIFSVDIPRGAVVTGTEFIDLATGQTPSSNPFENHTLTPGTPSCGDGGCTLSVILERTGPKVGTPSIDVRFYVDYEIPRYDGN